MTDFEIDVDTVENTIEVLSYEWRNAQPHAQHHRNKWAKQVHNELGWLKENVPDHFLLTQDFSDIKVV